MLAKKFRLPGYRLLSLLQSQKTFSSAFLHLKIKPASCPQALVAIVVSAKTARLATKRNRIKRLICASLQPYLPKLKSNQELLFLAKPQIAAKKLTEIQADMTKLLKQAELLNETTDS